jgi:hypothetical protein
MIVLEEPRVIKKCSNMPYATLVTHQISEEKWSILHSVTYFDFKKEKIATAEPFLSTDEGT